MVHGPGRSQIASHNEKAISSLSLRLLLIISGRVPVVEALNDFLILTYFLLLQNENRP